MNDDAKFFLKAVGAFLFVTSPVLIASYHFGDDFLTHPNKEIASTHCDVPTNTCKIWYKDGTSKIERWK